MPEEILRNIYRIQVPLPKNPLRVLNSYLIRGKDRSLLIDTGFKQPECRQALFGALRKLNVNRDTLDVFGTHIHSDHIGLAPEVVGHGRSIYLGKGDFHWAASEESNLYWEIMDRRFLVEGFPMEELEPLVHLNPARNYGPTLDLPNYQVVRGGDTFEIGGHLLEVVEAPGHTPGMVCLWMPEEAVMFTADHILFDITPNITMWPNMENALGTYLESLKKFRKFVVKKSLPGHREEGDYYGRIDELLLHHDRRVGETEKIVRLSPGMTTYEIAGRMTWAIKAKNWQGFPVIQKWFAVGEALSHLDYLISLGKLERRVEIGVHHYYPLP
ncbi:MAG: hypothetical protein K0S60_100 [Evtepia sp.]|nr:hypothetical protein [Evtepia sp.]